MPKWITEKCWICERAESKGSAWHKYEQLITFGARRRRLHASCKLGTIKTRKARRAWLRRLPPAELGRVPFGVLIEHFTDAEANKLAERTRDARVKGEGV